MTQPAIELDAQDEGAAAPTYDLNIITGGTVDSDKVIRWGGTDSADGAITNVTLPGAGDKWAEEQWLEDLSTTDYLLLDDTLDPDAVSQPYMTYKLTSDAEVFATAPRVTVYDSTSHTEAEEFIVGTSGHTSPFIKARGQTLTTAPPRWWAEASDAALHSKQSAGAVVFGDATGNEENCALEGDTAYLECSSTDINSNIQYFILAASIPSDAVTGVDIVSGVLSIRYTYT